jgi:hypothetical protein
METLERDLTLKAKCAELRRARQDRKKTLHMSTGQFTAAHSRCEDLVDEILKIIDDGGEQKAAQNMLDKYLKH